MSIGPKGTVGYSRRDLTMTLLTTIAAAYVFLFAAFSTPVWASPVDDMRALNQQVLALFASSKFDEAEQLSKQALPICDQIGENHAFCTGQFLEILGDIEFARKHFDDARTYLDKSLDVRQRAFGADHYVVGRSQMRIARTYIEENRKAEAEKSAKIATDIFSSTAPNSEDLATSIGYLVESYVVGGRFEEVVNLSRRRIAILAAIYGEDSSVLAIPKYVEAIGLSAIGQPEMAFDIAHGILAAYLPLPPENKYKLAFNQLLIEIGTKLYLAKDFVRLEISMRDALQLGLPPNSSTSSTRKEVATVHHLLAVALDAQRKYAEARQEGEIAYDIAKKAYDGTEIEFGIIVSSLASDLQALGLSAEAVKYALIAIPIIEATGKESESVGLVMLTLGRAQESLGQYNEALNSYRRAKGILDKALPEGAEVHVLILTDIGDVERDIRHLQASVVAYQEALDIEKRLSAKNPRTSAAVLTGLGLTLRSMGKYGEAERPMREAVALLENAQDKSGSSLSNALKALASNLWREQKFEEAETVAIRAINLSRSAAIQATALNTLGVIYVVTDRPDEARKSFLQAVEVRRSKNLSDKDSGALETCTNLANLDVAAGYAAKAEAGLRRCLEAARSAGSDYVLPIASQQIALAGALRNLGKFDEATVLLRESMAAYQRADPHHAGLRSVLRERAKIGILTTHEAEAENELQRLVNLEKESMDISATEASGDLMDLSTVLTWQGKIHEAEEAFADALSLIKASSSDHGSSLAIQSRERVAMGLLSLNKVEEAQAASLEVTKEIAPADVGSNVQKSQMYRDAAALVVAAGRPADSIRAYQEALRIDERVSSARGKAADRLGLATVYHLTGEWAAAIEQIDKARGDINKIGEPNLSSQISSIQATLAYERMSYAESLVHARHTVAILTEAYGSDVLPLVPSLCFLGKVYLVTGQIEEARSLIERINGIIGSDRPAPAWVLPDVNSFKAAYFATKGDTKSARSTLEESENFARRRKLPTIASVVVYNLGQIDLQEKRYDAAADRFVKAVDMFEREFGPQTPYVAFSYLELARAFGAQGDREGALRARDRGMKIFDTLGITAIIPRML